MTLSRRPDRHLRLGLTVYGKFGLVTVLNSAELGQSVLLLRPNYPIEHTECLVYGTAEVITVHSLKLCSNLAKFSLNLIT